jgi:hypothetical protein
VASTRSKSAFWTIRSKGRLVAVAGRPSMWGAGRAARSAVVRGRAFAGRRRELRRPGACGPWHGVH